MVGYPFSRCFSPHVPCVFLDTIINFTSGMRPSKWVTTQLRASHIWNIRCVYIYTYIYICMYSRYIYIYITLWESKIVGKITIKPRNSQLCVFVCHRISECRKIPPILQLDWGWWIPDIHWGCLSFQTVHLSPREIRSCFVHWPAKTYVSCGEFVL